MTGNAYDLTVLDDRNEIYKRFERIPLSYEEFNATMEFLTENLSKEWLLLSNTKIGEIVYPDKISIGKSRFNTIGIIQLIDIGRRLMLLSGICEIQKHYIKKLNDPSFQRVSTLQEIYAAGSYLERGFDVKVEPLNMRIGKSGKSGKCDFSVKDKNEQVFFEVTSTNIYEFPEIKTIWNFHDDPNFIKLEHEVEAILPFSNKVNLLIRNKGMIRQKQWRHKFLSSLRKARINEVNNVEENQFKITRKSTESEGKLWLHVLSQEQRRIDRILRLEKNQIPRNSVGAIIMGTENIFNAKKTAEYLIQLSSFNDIEAIILVDFFGKNHIVVKKTVSSERIDFYAVSTSRSDIKLK